jgi:hypothetical protein
MIETSVLEDAVANYHEYLSDILAAESAKASFTQVSIRLVRLRRQKLPVVQRLRLYEESLLQQKNDATDIISFNALSYEYIKASSAANMAELVYKMDHDAITNVKDTLSELIKNCSRDKAIVRAVNFIRNHSTRYVFGGVSDGTIKCKTCNRYIPAGVPVVANLSGKIASHLTFICITRGATTFTL